MASQPNRPANGPAAFSDRETSRQRGTRIAHDYLRRRTPMDRWRLAFVLLAVAVGVGWVAVTFAVPRAADAQASHGTLATVHATWDHQCEACHKPFTAINSNIWANGLFTRSTLSSSESANCVHCHAGPTHHGTMKPGTEANCGSCHRDHRGRDADIKSGVDADCTRCHTNLGAFTVGDKSAYQNVTSFLTDHPKFLVTKDPIDRKPFQPADRTLKFSHKLHMSPGVISPGDKGWTIGQIRAINPAMADRYAAEQPEGAGRDDKSVVQLSCASCHRSDAGRGDPPAEFAAKGIGDLPRETTLPVRQEGVHMLPITFENHCAGCHPLTFDSGRLAKTQAPHRVKQPELEKFLQGVYAEEVLTGVGRELTVRTLPRLDRPDEPTPEQTKARQAAIELATKGMERLRTGTCVKCHDLKPQETKAAPGMWEVADPAIPTIWFKHAFFDHASHKAVNCSHCHEDMWQDGPISEEVLRRDEKADLTKHLPAIDNCRECHAPATLTASGPRGGAGYGCSECHTYHNGDRNLQWRGSKHWVPAGQPERYKGDDMLRKFLEGRPNR